MQSQLVRTFDLADLFFGAAQRPTFVSLIEADESGRDVKGQPVTRWAGGVNATSRAPMFGPWKAFTLLARGDIKGKSKTPVPEFAEGCPLAGGFREDSLITSCSGWRSAEVDLMLTLALQWSLSQEVRFHHVGYKHVSKAARNEAIALFGVRALFMPASDHERYYIREETRQAPNGMYWIEHQLWPDDRIPGLHWDFATTNPEAMIEYIANNSGLKAETWQRHENSPCAMVQAVDLDGTEIAIMARPSWTKVEDW